MMFHVEHSRVGSGRGNPTTSKKVGPVDGVAAMNQRAAPKRAPRLEDRHRLFVLTGL